MQTSPFPIAAHALALACTLALAGCALGPDFHRPEPPAGESVLAGSATADSLDADGHAQHFERDTELPAKWWERFGSAEIDALVTQALAHSPQLLAAEATLRQSQENLAAGYGVFYPQIGAGVSAARQSSVVDFGHGLTSVGPYNVGTFSGTVSYVPDIFGAQRRTVEALGALTDLQRFNLRAAHLALEANVVNTAIARAGYQAQRDATADIVHLMDEQIRLAQAQSDAGVAPYSAVLALRGQQATSVAAVAALEQRVEQSEHLLAQLCGKAPAEFVAPRAALDAIALPGELPDSLPATLARRRPDILAAEASLHQASAQIGIATADLFPTLTIGGTAGASNSTISQMLRTGTKFWSLQADLAGSIFSGGSQWHARKAAIAAYDASLDQYQQTVLTALEQVADTMRALAHDAQGLRAQADALKAARENRDLVHASFEAGTTGYLDMLTADTQFQQASVAYLGGVAQRLQDTVALYAAVGGGQW